jgi:hypothetical protein
MSPTIRELSADAIVLPVRRKTVDKLASLFKNTLCWKRATLSVVATFKRKKVRAAIQERKSGVLISGTTLVSRIMYPQLLRCIEVASVLNHIWILQTACCKQNGNVGLAGTYRIEEQRRNQGTSRAETGGPCSLSSVQFVVIYRPLRGIHHYTVLEPSQLCRSNVVIYRYIL